MLTLRYCHLQPLERGYGHIGIIVAELTLLLRQSRDAITDNRVAAHPVVHGIAH